MELNRGVPRRRAHTGAWRSLVARLNGVQEVGSANLPVRGATEHLNVMWTNWKKFNKESLNGCSESPGVYYVRWVNGKGKSVPIPRILGKDTEGTLYIGMTGKGRDSDLCNRLWTFWDKASGRQGAHSGAKRFLRNLSGQIPVERLEYRYRQQKTRNRALRLERECLKYYEKQYGELPPLNGSGVV